jgi:hypothetical protein
MLAAGAIAVGSCARGDVGAPCNHGKTKPPESEFVTFPALSCNELLCVYADVADTPETPCDAGDHAKCNEARPDVDRFHCVSEEGASEGKCELKIEYVLERSMCSKKCSSDADCRDGGPTKDVVVDNTTCQLGFTCARIQKLGQFCCEKLCICRDDLDESTTEDIEKACAESTQQGCCVDETVENFVPSEACGPR